MPKAPRMPVWRRSAPAQDNISTILARWKDGRERTVDSDDVVGVASDSHVEGILATNLGQVLVGTDTASLKGLRRKLFVLVGDKMDTEREVVNTGLFAAQVEDSDLGMSQTLMQKKESTLESGTPRL